MRLSEIRTTAAAALIACAGLLAACGGDNGAASPEVAQGRLIFQRTCATCHGADARGMPGLGQNLHDNPFTQSLGDEELVVFLLEGRGPLDPLNRTGIPMPPKGGNPALTKRDLGLIVDYLRTLQ